MATDRVVFGSTVKVTDLSDQSEEDFTLVGPGDEDYDQNKILTSSPIGQGLLGKKIGEVSEIEIPSGLLRLRFRRYHTPESRFGFSFRSESRHASSGAAGRHGYRGPERGMPKVSDRA